MSFGKPCQYCSDSGCAIYEFRPRDPCRRFECAWVEHGSDLADSLRPDLCGAIVVTGRKFRGWEVIMATPTGWSIPDETLQQLIDWARLRNQPLVWIENIQEHGRYSHFTRSGYGPKAFLEAVKDPGIPLDIRSL
ncbi:MAG: hypothetical protein R3348_03710 [Xanthomonadales bacterium]|nr:hypothetical protein [Xanthomonadales bacterium]